MASVPLRLFRSKIYSWLFLIALLVGEAGLLHFSGILNPSANRGFLFKSEGHYVLAVGFEEEQKYLLTPYDSLSDALRDADRRYHLTVMTNPRFLDEVERAWIEERNGNSVLLWKTERVDDLHRWTFARQFDAEFFVSAFRKGAYTASPFGHALYFGPNAQ